ncbi:flagellar protein FliT [Paraburkholderia sp. CNPSo 3157]|uniref:Flagellar protein FliT n=1 Tax=Paraburkholderia franconis TaxID=2654983 RepID=A0A7X1NAT1_9BURK|nr:flagellar protein FliT [Paraburkholderia franconis]MPW18557.1 flagellar protein FliT [Paraburkholderia franconis]
MNSNEEYLARYEAIAVISVQMVMAARNAAWNDLVLLQDDYRHLVDALKNAETSVRLSEDDRARKFDLIRQILANDATVRDLANPRMAKLQALFAPGRPAIVLKELYQAR